MVQGSLMAVVLDFLAEVASPADVHQAVLHRSVKKDFEDKEEDTLIDGYYNRLFNL